MGKFAEFKLPLKGMPNGTQQFEYLLETEFFRNMENPDILRGEVKVTLNVKNNDGIYYLDFILKGSVFIPCDRCLDEIEHVVDTTYHLCVKYGAEYSDESDEVLIIPETDNYLNVAYMIYDTVVLTIPLKHIHQPGKCNKAMCARIKQHTATIASDNNDDDYDDDDDEFFDSVSDVDIENDNNNSECTDPRWDALKKLKDNN